MDQPRHPLFETPNGIDYSVKDKKALKKQAAEKALKTQQLLKSLKQDPNLLSAYPSFQQYTKNGLAATCSYYTAETLPKHLLEWTFSLTKRNVSKYYETCPGWGWNDSRKRRELGEDDARFIIISSPNNNNNDGKIEDPIAFIHFRFEIERDMPVLYVFEIQVESQAQGKGLGKFLMLIVELIARKSGLCALMLTVFCDNVLAMKLYKGLGYSVDEDSPEEDCGYEILIKKL